MKRFFVVCYIIILLICISSCNIKHNNTSSQTNSFKKETSISAIKKVVVNKKEFLSTETNQYIYLKDLHSGNYLFENSDGQYEYTNDAETMDYLFGRFSVIDMDGDEYPELLMEESKSGNRLLFHYENDIVYGFIFPFRGMENVKEDASFISSGSAISNYVKTVQFSKGIITYNALCICDGLDNVYRTNGKNVNQEEANEYLMKQYEKENLEWHIYNESSLEQYFVP